MPFTYRELIEGLKTIPEKHLDDDASIYLEGEDEVFPIHDLITNWKTPFPHQKDPIENVDGILDDGHPFFTVANGDTADMDIDPEKAVSEPWKQDPLKQRIIGRRLQ